MGGEGRKRVSGYQRIWMVKERAWPLGRNFKGASKGAHISSGVTETSQGPTRILAGRPFPMEVILLPMGQKLFLGGWFEPFQGAKVREKI